MIIQNELEKELERVKNGLQFKLPNGYIASMKDLIKQINEADDGLYVNVVKD